MLDVAEILDTVNSSIQIHDAAVRRAILRGDLNAAATELGAQLALESLVKAIQTKQHRDEVLRAEREERERARKVRRDLREAVKLPMKKGAGKVAA